MCEEGFTRCKSGGPCINLRWFCDNDIDCPDGSDEEGCAGKISYKNLS